MDQAGGERESLLPSAGELTRELTSALGQSELFQALPHGLPPILHRIHPRHKIEIFLDAQVFPKAESLRHVADFPFDRFALVDDIVTETSTAPIVCAQQSAEHAQKCGLAAAVRSE